MTHAILGLFLILKNKSPAIHPQSEQNAQAAQPFPAKKAAATHLLHHQSGLRT
jgi:hypothetical protein